jgi:hypothetical protein
MQRTIFETDDSMPKAVKEAAATALPSFLESDKESTLASGALDLASALGDTGDFGDIMKRKSAAREEAEKHLVQGFRKNIELLVQKTWVDKTDEALKEEVLFRIDALCKSLSKPDYHAAYTEFLPVLHDVVYLLFGSLSRSDSFLEYAVRIDPDFGFFWYYINSLPAKQNWKDEKCRAAVLLGIFFLANF